MTTAFQGFSPRGRQPEGARPAGGAQHAWIHRNQTYPGVYEALRACEHPWYVASSKAAHRISPLLRSLLGVDMDEASPRLFAGLIPPEERKIAALRCGARARGQPPLAAASSCRVALRRARDRRRMFRRPDTLQGSRHAICQRWMLPAARRGHTTS